MPQSVAQETQSPHDVLEQPASQLLRAVRHESVQDLR